MIRRRSVIIGMCSLVAAPAIVRADSLMRLTRPTPLPAKLCLPTAPEPLLLSIRGWGTNEGAIPIYLPSSWRATWL
jgi:hypothetical protein